MIGLAFLSAAILWLGLSLWLALKLPAWLRVQSPARRSGVTATALAALIVGPFVDEIVGMRQFERLCRERATVWTSADASSVTRAIKGRTRFERLPGYWITIHSQQIEYLNAGSGKPFLKYEILHTKGGRIAGIALLGGEHSCSPPAPNAMNELNIDKLVKGD